MAYVGYYNTENKIAKGNTENKIAEGNTVNKIAKVFYS